MSTRSHTIRLWLITMTTVLALAPTANAYTITLNGAGTSYVRTLALVAGDPVVLENLFPTTATLPFTSPSSSSHLGGSSTATHNLSGAGFDITFTHIRPVGSGANIESSALIYFSVDVATDYAASGSYTAVDTIGERVYLKAALYDFDTASYVFDSTQRSVATPNEAFTLGLTEGDDLNVSLGSLTGTLVAGHQYVYQYNTYVQGYGGPTLTASGIGDVSFALTPVPEPGTAVLMGLGLLGLGVRRGTPPQP